MLIRSPEKKDWQQFSALTEAEGWRVPEAELRLFQTDWAQCVDSLEVEGRFAGLVTAVSHEQSGWVGNLIVPPQLRGRGYGSRLFQSALQSLTARGISSFWLTASELGRAMYERFGFVTINRIERWVQTPAKSFSVVADTPVDAVEKLLELDCKAWGESRSTLLDAVLRPGRTFVCDDSVALLQRGRDLQVIGPWYSQSGCPRANRQIIRELLIAADPGVPIVTDLLASSPLRSLLVAAGFSLSGDAALMMKGDAAAVGTEMMVSLASLGSIG